MAARLLEYAYAMLSYPLAILSYPLKVLIAIFRIVFVPWRSNYEPIKSLLDAETTDAKDGQTMSWRDRKLAELSSVSITGAILASVVAQTFCWPQVQAPSSKLPFAYWYSSLSLCFAAICLATQQAVALNRISTYADAARRIRLLIGERLLLPDSGGDKPHGESGGELAEEWIPSKVQLYVWQTPIMCLNFGIGAFAIGFAIFMFWNEDGSGLEAQGAVTLEGKDLLIPALVGGFAVAQYIVATGLLYHRTSSIEG